MIPSKFFQTSPTSPYTLALLLASLSLAYRYIGRRQKRSSLIPPSEERVLVLGASSGIGRSIAFQYASRGAKVCLVGRRFDKITEAVAHCLELQAKALGGISDHTRVLGMKGDFADIDSMVAVRNSLEAEWGGIDTVVIAAGVSALRPLLTITETDSPKSATAGPTTSPSSDGLRKLVDVSKAAVSGNYYGPMIAAAAFVPILEATSASPAIMVISSLAAVIPAPTRTIYASTKAASFILLKALSIEHPKITFSCILPSTVEGDFRISAVDAGEVREEDPSKSGLRRDDVARRSIRAVDNGEKTVFMPSYMIFGMALYWLWPSFVEKKARQKYRFNA